MADDSDLDEGHDAADAAAAAAGLFVALRTLSLVPQTLQQPPQQPPLAEHRLVSRLVVETL